MLEARASIWDALLGLLAPGRRRRCVDCGDVSPDGRCAPCKARGARYVARGGAFALLTDAARSAGPGGSIGERCPGVALYVRRYVVQADGRLVDLRKWDRGICDLTPHTAEEMERLDALRARTGLPFPDVGLPARSRAAVPRLTRTAAERGIDKVPL